MSGSGNINSNNPQSCGFKKSYRVEETLHLLKPNQYFEDPPRAGCMERISMHAVLSDNEIAGKFRKILALKNIDRMVLHDKTRRRSGRHCALLHYK